MNYVIMLTLFDDRHLSTEARMGINEWGAVRNSQGHGDDLVPADSTRTGPRKIITNNGVNCVSRINELSLDDNQLEHQRKFELLINEASQGLDDIAAGRTEIAGIAIGRLIHRRRS